MSKRNTNVSQQVNVSLRGLTSGQWAGILKGTAGQLLWGATQLGPWGGGWRSPATTKQPAPGSRPTGRCRRWHRAGSCPASITSLHKRF